MALDIKEKTKETTTVKCGFCKGSGKDPFGLLSPLATCEVCLGRGTVTLKGPVKKCVYCQGSGVYPHSRLTCTVCGGKGVFTIEGPTKVCTSCLGTGHAPESDLPCLICQGRGAILRR